MMQSCLRRMICVFSKTYDSEICSAARALELMGERWTLLIVRNALFGGATRYNDFPHGTPPILLTPEPLRVLTHREGTRAGHPHPGAHRVG